MEAALEIPLEEKLAARKASVMINELEAEIAKHPQVDMPLRHFFTPGLYSRSILMRKGTVLTSKIHRMTHPFAVLEGEFIMHNDGEEAVRIKAPFFGVTQAGTRRALLILEDTVMVAFYATDETDLAKIEAILIEPNPLPICSEKHDTE